MLIWEFKHPRMTMEALGFIPYFLDERDPRPAREQFNSNYQGGWNPFPGFILHSDNSLKYPGDPPLPVLAETKLRNETIRFYDCAWVSITQEDGTWEVCRMD